MTAVRPAIWLQCAVPRPRAKHLLVCFPHAGGSASFYGAWGQHLPDYELHAVRYPGRAERIAEVPPSDLKMLACDVADAVERIADRPVALFGHSMGAAVALETARFLEARDVELSHLFASGSRHIDRAAGAESAPMAVGAPDAVDDHDDDAISARLVGLGGTQRDLAQDPVFRELVLPYVRSDGQMFRSYMMRLLPRLRCGITAIVGDADDDADRRPWRELTSTGFNERSVTGGHFFLIAAPPYELLQEILQTIPNATVARTEVTHAERHQHLA